MVELTTFSMSIEDLHYLNALKMSNECQIIGEIIDEIILLMKGLRTLIVTLKNNIFSSINALEWSLNRLRHDSMGGKFIFP